MQNSSLLKTFCQWKGNIHTSTDKAQHQSNGLVERKIGQLNESTRAALLASDLPAYLWLQVYMAMCHTQNIVPSSALQRELKKEKKEQLEKNAQKEGEEGSTPGEQGDAEAQAAAESLEVPVRDMIPYLAFHSGTSDEYFKQLVGQLKPWGYQFLCTTGVTICATSTHGVRRDSTWAQGQVPAWTEYS